MNKQARAKLASQVLQQFFPDPHIPLHYSDPYTLLIAALLSAQCTDVRVNKITPTLFTKAYSPEAMILLSHKEIETIIRPCGLGPSKAKNIWKLSKILVDQYKGQVPSTFEALEALPGVGHKTASVVMCQAFNKPAFPVDTHIHRCAKRWGLSSGKSARQTEHDLKELFPKSCWKTLHLQIILFARAYCPARGHRKKDCPICSALRRSP